MTYIVLMMVYSANNLPYSALSGVMTGDLGERTSLSSYRFVFAMLAQLVIQGLALPMVHYFGQGNNAKGYQVTMGIFSALAVVLFLITFATTRERIQPPPGQKASVGQHFADLLKNGPWLAMFVLTLVLFITLAMRGSVVPYYFNYYVDKASLAGLLGAFGVAEGGPTDEGRIVSLGFSVFNVLGTLATIVAIFFSKAPRRPLRQAQRLHRRPRRRRCCSPRPSSFLPPAAVTADVRVRDPAPVRLRLHDPAAVGDDGRRRGLLGVEDGAPRDRRSSSPPSCSRSRRGWASAARSPATCCRCYGYVPNVAQGATALDGIRYTMSVFPAVTFAICAVVPALLRHRQADRDPDDERAGRAAPAVRVTRLRGAGGSAR